MKHHLLHFTILSLFCLRAFAADPMWIWKVGTIASEEANFKTTLTPKGKPAKAPLIITCDNSFKLNINGKRATASKNWETPVKMDVAKFLQAGKKKLVTNKSWMAQSHEGGWHRFAGEGMGIGPDLTGSANRCALQDMMENIVETSKVISDQYISTEFTMKDGSTVIGHMAEEKVGMLHLMTNPFLADSNVQIKAADVKSRKPHEVSHMPPSLINGLNSDELSDLGAYIFSAGDKDHQYFSGGKKKQ